jgi:hypothetical protein
MKEQEQRIAMEAVMNIERNTRPETPGAENVNGGWTAD